MPNTEINIPDSFAVTAHGFTIDVHALHAMSADAIAYLVRNGFTQSITDAAAFSAKDKDGKSESEVAAMAAEARQKRFDAILAGEVGSRGPSGPRLGVRESYAAEFAVAQIRKAPAFVSGKVAWPTGAGSAATIRGWIDAWYARPGNRDVAFAEADRRITAEATLPPADVDFDPTA